MRLIPGILASTCSLPANGCMPEFADGDHVCGVHGMPNSCCGASSIQLSAACRSAGLQQQSAGLAPESLIEPRVFSALLGRCLTYSRQVAPCAFPMTRRTPYVAVGLCLVFAAVAALLFIPFSHAEGDFWDNMRECLRFGYVPSAFLPDFYPYLSALVYKPFGPSGVVAMQAGMYLGVAACVFLTLRRVTGEDAGSALGAGAILLDPDLLSSIPKLWDTEMTVLLLLALIALSLALRERDWVAPVSVGLVWGLSLSVRPNFAVLALPIGYGLFLAYGRRAVLRGALVGALAFGTLAAANTAAHGSFYLPQNGPYNLFAGANGHSEEALLALYNGEPSIPEAMHEDGYPGLKFYELRYKPVFTRLAFGFMAAHPLQWLWLDVVKLGTLLRPDTKAHPLFSAPGLVKLLTSLSMPLWLGLLLASRPLRQVDKLFVLFAAAYVLPFVLTNADPRFRPALDVLVLTHGAALVLRRLERGRGSPVGGALYRRAQEARYEHMQGRA